MVEAFLLANYFAYQSPLEVVGKLSQNMLDPGRYPRLRHPYSFALYRWRALSTTLFPSIWRHVLYDTLSVLAGGCQEIRLQRGINKKSGKK